MSGSPLPELSKINDAIERIVESLINGGHRINSSQGQAEATGLLALLELRRQKIAESCPTCKGEGTRWSDATRSIDPCPNRSSHL